MGIELERFVQTVDEELKCSICCAVLENPIQLSECEHTFCLLCIQEWIKRQSKCPIDRQNIRKESFKPVSRLLRTFLNRLKIRCDFSNLGCNAVIPLETLSSHISECHFDPNKVFFCDKGCGLQLTAQQKVVHNCLLEDILINVENQNKRIGILETIIEKQFQEFSQRIEELEKRCFTKITKYKTIKNNCNELINRFSSTGISVEKQISGHSFDVQGRDQEIEEINEIQFNCNSLKKINIEFDYKKERIEMLVNTRETIKNIKHRIKLMDNLSIESQCLFSGNQLLFDENTLEDYSLTSMDLVLVKRPISVYIILFSGNISFILEPFDTISRLRDQIFNSKGFNVRLTYFGQLLDEKRTFHSYGIRDRAKLKVIAIECKTGPIDSTLKKFH